MIGWVICLIWFIFHFILQIRLRPAFWEIVHKTFVICHQNTLEEEKIRTIRNAHFKIRIFLINVGGDGRKNLEHHSSNSSIASSQGEPPIKTWHSLVQTYKIIMNTLHIKPHMKRPQTKEIVIYVTSVFDQKCFWGQIVEDVSENMAFLYNHKPRPVLGVMFYLIEK